MHDIRYPDYYEVLQISPNANGTDSTSCFVCRARRYHPDNARSGNATVFRQLHEAYTVLNDPERRAHTTPSMSRNGRTIGGRSLAPGRPRTISRANRHFD